jgi:5'-3' exonuclease
MGIKFFYKWLSRKYPQCINGFTKAKPSDVKVDVFMIDMNGIFHNSAQRVFKYGNNAPKSVLRRPEKVPFNMHTRMRLFEDVVKTIDDLVMMVRPSTTVVFAVDGVAPASKMNQQRQRRFRSSMSDSDSLSFDPICITPGTVFMDNLSKYIDWFIRKKISESEYWASLKVVFSNEKQPGEGEHKLIDYIRKYGSADETFCINALDADLVMLSLSTFKPKFYLLREELYSYEYDYSYVSIGKLHTELKKTLCWKDDSDNLIKDFILICFLCGNDFLPNIPSISIIENGLDFIIDIYKTTCKNTNSYITDGNNKIDFVIFKSFLKNVGLSEEGMLCQKALNKNNYIPDPLFEKYTSYSQFSIVMDDESSTEETVVIDLDGYKKAYYEKKNIKSVESASHDYLDGCQWVLTYYLSGIDDWSWVYPYSYAPFAMEISESISTYTPSSYNRKTPITPFEQLLCVIPPKSSNLLPSPLNDLLKSPKFSMFCPKEVVVNCDGKKFEYEGVVELPVVDIGVVRREFERLKTQIDDKEIRRNIVGKTFCYTASDFTEVFSSYYGLIKNHKVTVKIM